jgi:3-oxoacyl-[acyl-carrier protein] reductase
MVNIASVVTALRVEGEAAYAASKAALLGLTEVLARELAPVGITVNAIGVAPTDTDMIRGVPPDKLARLLARMAIPRLATIGDVVWGTSTRRAPSRQTVGW